MTCALCTEEFYLEKRSVAHDRFGISRGLEGLQCVILLELSGDRLSP